MVVIERESELAQVKSLLEAASSGEGAAMLIEGAAGIGKTSLMRLTCDRAAERGITVLRARAAELEREIAFGVARQLLTAPVRDASERKREQLLAGAARLARGPLALPDAEPGSSAPAPGAELHGIYWLCANICDRGPLLLAVDDLHWSDLPSLRLLAYLARRASEHPLAILAASRPTAADDPAARALGGLWSEVVRLAPLSESAVRSVVEAELQGGADEGFCAACSSATGGNPFLLAAAIAALRAAGVAPRAGEIDRLAELSSETLGRAILARITRVGPDAVAVARALAVLGRDAALRHVAKLVDLDVETAAATLELLRHEGIAAPEPAIELAHPLVRNAVEAGLAEPARGLTQLRAARLLRDEGEPAERVAAHLGAAEPTGLAWVVETLRAAAADALDRGAPESAVTLLRRALAEPPAAAERGPLLAELGGALARAGCEQEAVRTLIEAAELSPTPAARAQVALGLGPLLYAGAFCPEALAALHQARMLLGDGDPELAGRLEAAIAVARHIVREPADAWVEPLETSLQSVRDPTARAICLAGLAYAASGTGARPAAEVLQLASEAARHAQGEGIGDPNTLHMITASLAIGGRPSASLPLLDRAIEAASRLGDATSFSMFSLARARTRLVAGSASTAEADAWAALSVADQPAAGAPFALGVLVLVLVERGRLQEADRELESRGLAGALQSDRFQDCVLLQGRASLRLAEGRAPDALRDCLAMGDQLAAVGFTNPAYSEWRSLAALAHFALGSCELARQVAADELALARGFGAPREIGIALRTLGLAEGAERGLKLLEESVAVLEGSEAKLELARSLVDRGAALRRAGCRRDAREPLRQGLDLAQRCGGLPLACRAREELRAAGGRPRRVALSGPDSLTPSELRVARLAADGRSNREIAQSLFVTRRTVEVHLTSAYRKLGIDSRDRLAMALER